MRFAEEIAVLDGLSGAGKRYDGMPPTLPRKTVIDASGGATYTGGSSWVPGMTLTPSNAGLAALDATDLVNKAAQLKQKALPPGVLPHMRNVIAASGGATYTGGSSWDPFVTMTPSNAGLASDMDLLNQMTSLPMRTNVVDPNGGQYTGGNSYSPYVPMMPSSAGLAGMQMSSKVVQMSAKELQQLLMAAGQKVNVTGIWAPSNLEAIRSFINAVSRATGRRPIMDMELKEIVRPYAGGKEVLVFNTLLRVIADQIGPRGFDGVSMAAIDAVPDSALTKGASPKMKKAFAASASQDKLDALKQILASILAIQAKYNLLTPEQQYQARMKVGAMLSTISRVRGLRGRMLASKAGARTAAVR